MSIEDMDAEDHIMAGKMDRARMFDLLDGLKAAANAVLSEMRLTAGGDKYTYRGSTSDVDWLREAAEAWENYQMEMSTETEL